MFQKALFVFSGSVQQITSVKARSTKARPFSKASYVALFAGITVSMSLTGCVTYMPVDEYNLARISYDAAKDADAARYAPALWFSTEQAYRDGQKAFDERDYGGARRLFISSREFAEKAENAARYARHQSGDVVP